MQWTITAYAPARSVTRTCVVSRAVGFASRGIEATGRGCVEQTAWYARFISLALLANHVCAHAGRFCGMLRRALAYHRQHGACIPQRSVHYRGVSRNARCRHSTLSDDFQTEFESSLARPYPSAHEMEGKGNAWREIV